MPTAMASIVMQMTAPRFAILRQKSGLKSRSCWGSFIGRILLMAHSLSQTDPFRLVKLIATGPLRVTADSCAAATFRPIGQDIDADEHGSFGQPCFAKPLNHQLRSF